MPLTLCILYARPVRSNPMTLSLMEISENTSKKTRGLSDRSLNKTERLFAMVLLLQNKPNLTTRDLSDHFGISRRTVFRDLRALSESGVPLTYAEGGGYEILEGYQLPPLMLSAREAATLLVGTKFATLQPDASLRQDADAVAMKIRSVLPKSVQEYIDRLAENTVMDPYWVNSVHEQPDEKRSGLWYDLSEAMARQQSVYLKYYTRARDVLTERKVDPLGIVYYFDHWNLIGYCHLRNGIRNFRFDNIEEMYKMSERFDRPTDFDLQDFLKRQGAGSVHRISVRFNNRIYQWARRRIPAHIEEELSESEDRTRVSFYFENLDYLANWLMSYGAAAEVIEPEALRERIANQAGKMLLLYDTASG